MSWFIRFRAVFVRFLFATHGLVVTLLLYRATENPLFWLIAVALVGLCVETAITLKFKRGQEYKWCCPSVMFYLLCVVPAIWFLELHQLDLRLQQRDHLNNSTNTTTYSCVSTSEAEHLVILGIGVSIVNDEWVKINEQLLLLLLILGRWMLPKGKLTHDQLSQLLLVYIGTAGDIVEFFEAFKEEGVRCDRLLCIIILSIWSWSLLQFTMVLTATKARKDKTGLLPNRIDYRRNSFVSFTCCTPDVYGIIISISMQDIPFLVVRLLLIFNYNIVSYTNTFFTCKNSLVCSLLLYRLIVVQIERRHPSFFKSSSSSRHHSDWNLKESASGARLIAKSTSTMATAGGIIGEYYNYKTTVNLSERAREDDDDMIVNYVVKRHFSASGGVVGDEAGPGGVIMNDSVVDFVVRRHFDPCLEESRVGGRVADGDWSVANCVVVENRIACGESSDNDVVFNDDDDEDDAVDIDCSNGKKFDGFLSIREPTTTVV